MGPGCESTPMALRRQSPTSCVPKGPSSTGEGFSFYSANVCLKAPIYMLTVSALLLYTVSGIILVSWEWCVEIEAGSSIVSASVWRLLIGRWGQDMKALQWHSGWGDGNDLCSRALKGTHLPVNSIICFSASISGIILVSDRNGVLRLKQGHPLCLQVLGDF